MDGSDDGFLTAEEVLRFNNNGRSVNFNVAGGGTAPAASPSYAAGRDGNGFRPWNGERPRGGPDGNGNRGERPRMGPGGVPGWWGGNMGGGGRPRGGAGGGNGNRGDRPAGRG
jgi:hypothetical protein